MKTNYSLSLGAVLFAAILCWTPSALQAADAAQVTGSVSGVAGQIAAVADQLNINTANVDALAAVPGLGPEIAEAISKYREAHGAFTSLNDLVNVDGINMELLEKIKPFLTL